MISVFPLIYIGMYFAVRDLITASKPIQDIVRVSSSGPAGELYPDSLGDYYKLTIDVTLNDLPVYQHSARDDRYINGNGNFYEEDISIYLILH